MQLASALYAPALPQPALRWRAGRPGRTQLAIDIRAEGPPGQRGQAHVSRRAGLVAGTAAAAVAAYPRAASAATVSMPGLKDKDFGKEATIYPDYTLTKSGLQFQDLRIGDAGEPPSAGEEVVVDWDGFTIGYYGRIIQAKNLAKGGAFEGTESDFLRFRVGDGSVIPAFEEAVSGMRVGGIRRIIVPPGPLTYPDNGDGTQSFKKVGPRPSTFSGRRSLDFVLSDTGLMDKTLLFDLELMNVSKNGLVRRGAGTWVKGPNAK